MGIIKLSTVATMPNSRNLPELKGNQGYPAVAEYLKLPTIRKKLAFKCDRRKGAKMIKNDQKALRSKLYHVKGMIENNLSLNNLPIPLPDNYRFTRFYLKHWDQALLERDNREGKPRQTLGLNLESTAFKEIGGLFYCESVDRECDYDFYYKSWHRRYGPKVKITNYINFAVQPFFSTRVKIRSRTGDYVLRAALNSGLFTDIKSKYPMSLRLKKCFDIKLIKGCARYELYSRTLNSVHYDYVVKTRDGYIAHADSVDQALELCERKKKSKLTGKILTVKYCHENLGFCHAGMESFLDLVGLSHVDKIGVNDLKRHIEGCNLTINQLEPFKAELEKLGCWPTNSFEGSVVA